MAATYQYDPYGTATATSETGLGQSNLVRYAGGTYDKHTTLTKYGQRWYNPQQGRFTQQDNLSFIGDPQHGNRYAYAGANPTNYVDPTGQAPEETDFDYVMNTTASWIEVGAGAGFLTGCAITAVAGCVKGGLVGAGIGAGAGFVGGLGYSTGRLCRENDCLG